MQHLDVIVEDARWQTLGLEALATRAVTAALGHLNIVPELAELSVLACDDPHIATLNAEFRDKPTPTNVLSWPAQELAIAQDGVLPAAPELGFEDTFELGDIAISYDTCAAEAKAANKPLQDHATHLIIHGTLHLLGYDHISDGDAVLMERAEVEILGKLGLDNPYIT